MSPAKLLKLETNHDPPPKLLNIHFDVASAATANPLVVYVQPLYAPCIISTPRHARMTQFCEAEMDQRSIYYSPFMYFRRDSIMLTF